MNISYVISLTLKVQTVFSETSIKTCEIELQPVSEEFLTIYQFNNTKKGLINLIVHTLQLDTFYKREPLKMGKTYSK